MEASSGGPRDISSRHEDILTNQKRGNRRRNSSEKDKGRGRQNSLRRVKNSTDVLRKRSLQRSQKDITPDGSSGGREGRQFTVANVGNNGIIYLRFVYRRRDLGVVRIFPIMLRSWGICRANVRPRPVVRPTQERSQVPPFVFPPATPPSSATFEGSTKRTAEEPTRNSLWTQLSTPTRTRRVNSVGQRSNSRTSYLTHHARSLSQSTIDAQSANKAAGAGSFKVVIDRSASIQEPVQNQRSNFPTLEVPIPHYRLGTPRFSARGTAFLHNSVYTRSSANEDMRSSMFSGGDYDRLFPIPPGMEPRAVPSRRHSHASAQPQSMRITPVHSGPQSSVISQQQMFHQAKEPILPAIYDSLAANADDPSIVRYSPSTGEIVAASPARLVAQITSENFLDYELLSDFFLTVRAYLSTRDLLSYLLARFEWAINRFDDHGRIIRVRAFAALRHWILNYFTYDFVLDRELRVQFCEQLNRLSKDVCNRPSHGASDLKLISDLKKCWNGRCVLYWDSSLAVGDGHNDVDIRPGGVAGSRNSQLSHPSQLRPTMVSVEPPQIGEYNGHATSELMMDKWYDAVLDAGANSAQGHTRQISVATTRSLPTSPTSEQSIQAMSCSVPAKSFRRMVHHSTQASAIRPVIVTPNTHRVCPAAPSALSNDKETMPRTGHKRSGSFSDAVRDNRAPLPFGRASDSEEQLHMAFPYSGSLVRGNIIPPGTPHVHVFAPTTPAVELPNISFPSQDDLDDINSHKKLNPPTSPGVRNLFGSIRRVLSSKTSGSHHSSNFGGSGLSAPSLSVGKKSTLPTNMIYHAGSGSSSRIDLMALDSLEAFRQAVDGERMDMVQAASSIGIASGNEREQPSPDTQPPITILRPGKPLRKQSELTTGSKSIMIFDDTGPDLPDLPDLPTMSNALLLDVNCHKLRPDSFSMARSVPPTLSVEPSFQQLPRAENTEALPKNAFGHDPTSTQIPALVKPVIERKSSIKITKEFVSKDDELDSRGPPTMNRGRSFRSTHSKSVSISLRRYASFQSTFTRHVPERSFDVTTVTIAPDSAPTFSNDNSEQSPAHILRRRPGGDLRAHQNVHDLEQMPRPRSVGSITTYTDSLGGSGLLMTSDMGAIHTSSHTSSQIRRFPHLDSTLHGVTKVPSLVRTHSSQPALRPSFEAAVAEFARIPDDEEGGIEATLLKLEGRYQKSPVDLSTPHSFAELDVDRMNCRQEGQDEEQESFEKRRHRHEHVVEETFSMTPSSQCERSNPTEPASLARGSQHFGDGGEGIRPTIPSTLYAESEESYNSIPLLERALSGRSKKNGRSVGTESKATMPRPLFSRNHKAAYSQSQSPDLSIEHIEVTDSLRRVKRGSSVPTTTTDSFLLDEDEYLSDLSSEMSIEMVDRDDAVDYVQDTSTHAYPETIVLNIGCHPPSPPMTMENALSITSQAKQAHEQRKPPTPDPSPISQHVEPNIPQGPHGRYNHAPSALPPPIRDIHSSKHICFILGYDSELLAQQFTILEKEALNEVDWRDLVDMRWHNTSPSVTNWVQYLQTQDPKGIDLVTARFNLIVKWALSEIVLTQNIEERALTIMKYIHIAQQCRRLRNYATMLQLAIAMTSVDCSRLTKTWELVPAAEKSILQELENLVTPRRNFHNLRLEMETANAEEGCIPVVGM